MRTTQIRKYSGELWSIRNGELNIFGNLNRDFSRAIVQVGVAYEADLRQAMAVMVTYMRPAPSGGRPPGTPQ